MHLLIPYAACDAPDQRQLLQGLDLPRLARLLAQLRPEPDLTLAPDAPTLAHEYVHAAALGLPPDAPAWAALRAHELGLSGALGDAWAFISPSHWELGQAQVTLRDPQALDLTEDESHALLAAMQPYFAQDGITLHYEQPLRWLAQGEAFRGLGSAAPERVIGRNVAPWLPASPLLRRLQNEMQMLLYTHAVTEARAQRGALAVNSFWLSGSGALTAAPGPQPTRLVVPQDLVRPAVRGDWATWRQAWQGLDATDVAALQGALDAGRPDVRLTLCSEQRARSYVPAPRDWWSRTARQVSGRFGRRGVSDILADL